MNCTACTSKSCRSGESCSRKNKPQARKKTINQKDYLALAFSIVVISLTIFFPIAGLIIPVMMLTAVIGNFFKRNWFCTTACPRARILGSFLPRISAYRQMPKWLYSEAIRKVLCGFVLICSIAQTGRLWRSLENLGWFFFSVCAISLIAALILGVVYKPRSWCALCPIGTLQRTIGGK